MRFGRSTLPLIAFVLGTSGGFVVAQGHDPYQPANGSGGAYAQEYDHEHHDDWDQPPHEFREIQRQGFHDGVEGAKKDFEHHRMPDVSNRDEYRHPSVSKAYREDYREGYHRGYDAAMAHLTGQPGPR